MRSPLEVSEGPSLEGSPPEDSAPYVETQRQMCTFCTNFVLKKIGSSSQIRIFVDKLYNGDDAPENRAATPAATGNWSQKEGGAGEREIKREGPICHPNGPVDSNGKKVPGSHTWAANCEKHWFHTLDLTKLAKASGASAVAGVAEPLFPLHFTHTSTDNEMMKDRVDSPNKLRAVLAFRCCRGLIGLQNRFKQVRSFVRVKDIPCPGARAAAQNSAQYRMTVLSDLILNLSSGFRRGIIRLRWCRRRRYWCGTLRLSWAMPIAPAHLLCARRICSCSIGSGGGLMRGESLMWSTMRGALQIFRIGHALTGATLPLPQCKPKTPNPRNRERIKKMWVENHTPNQ